MTVDTAVPPSQDEATEGTMSSEALPLIFDPSEDVTSEAAAAQTAAAVQPLLLPGGTGPPAVGPPVDVDPERPGAAEADGEGPSNAPPPDWTSPETVAPLAPMVPLPTERQADRGEASHMATVITAKLLTNIFRFLLLAKPDCSFAPFLKTSMTFAQLVFFNHCVMR